MSPLQLTAIDAKRQATYRLLQVVMLGDVALGLGLILAALTVLEMPAVAIGGAFLAVTGLGMALVFRHLARRNAVAPTARSSWVRPR
jgi:hypothetical protein